MTTYSVALLGARMHYALPRALASRKRLGMLYTDLCTPNILAQGCQVVPHALQPALLKRLIGRGPEGIPPQRIRAFNLFGVEYAARRWTASRPGQAMAVYLWAGREFCKLIIASGLRDASGIITFNSAGLELLQCARKEGRRAVMEQTIAPMVEQVRLLQAETERFPGWEETQPSDHVTLEFIERERAEWGAATQIICGSDFVRESIAADGGPVAKCTVIPYGVATPCNSSVARKRLRNTLRVLTVGSVGLRKGAPYVYEAAKLLKGRAEFRWVGPVALTAQAAAEMRRYVALIGSLPRTEAAAHYEWADVFLLPSVCEGSATATYEALSWGLPVVCTPNTGSVVRTGTDGFVVRIRDAEAIAARLEDLMRDRALMDSLSANARCRAADYDIPAYTRRLMATLAVN